MEQAILNRGGKRSGWSENENKLLWETADEAQQQGMPLKTVFEQIAKQTGRRPNSIRNYYYAQVRSHEDGQARTARFVPFTQNEVDWLMEQVLIARAAGQSVRSCLQKLAAGDHSLMLRYQNKYRAVIKSRPEYVRSLVEKLNSEGVNCDTPQVNHRAHADLSASCAQLTDEVRRSGDAELAKACDVLVKYLRSQRESGISERLYAAVNEMMNPLRNFLALDAEEKAQTLDDFCAEMTECIGNVEEALMPERSDGK